MRKIVAFAVCIYMQQCERAPRLRCSSRYRVHSLFHPFLGGLSVCILAYSIGNPSQTPFLIIAIRYNLPTSLPSLGGSPIFARSSAFMPSASRSRKASQALYMLLYRRESSSSRALRSLDWWSCQARWMVQWRKARRRDHRSGRGVRGCWRW